MHVAEIQRNVYMIPPPPPAVSAWLVKTRRARSRRSRDAMVYGHTTTAMHKLSIPPPRIDVPGIVGVQGPVVIRLRVWMKRKAYTSPYVPAFPFRFVAADGDTNGLEVKGWWHRSGLPPRLHLSSQFIQASMENKDLVSWNGIEFVKSPR